MLVVKSCLTLCDPMDYSPPGSSVQGVLQARILIRVRSHSLVQGIFLTRRSNSGLLRCRQIVHHLSHQGECSENLGPHQSELPVEQDRFWGLFVGLVGSLVSFFFFFWLYWVFIAVCQLSQVVSSWGYSLAVVHGLLTAVASLLAEHGSRCGGFNSCGTRA